MDTSASSLSVEEILEQGRYDDRDHEAFARVQSRSLLTHIAFLAADVLAYVLLRTYARPLVDLASPLGIAVNIIIVLAFASVFMEMAFIPKGRYYVIEGGVLEYPRFGYTKRFGLSLREVDEYSREGRGHRKQIVLLSHGKRKLVIPESELAAPDEFARTLRFWKARERDAKIVRVARH